MAIQNFTNIDPNFGCILRDLPADKVSNLFKADIYSSHPPEVALTRTIGLLLTSALIYYSPAKLLLISASFIGGAALGTHSLNSLWKKVSEPSTIVKVISIIAATVLLLKVPQVAAIASLATAVYGIWTAYSNLFSEDPLVNAFHKMAGGKDQFEKLPELPLSEGANPIQTRIGQCDWNELNQPVYRTKTDIGGNAMVVKTLQAPSNEKGVDPLSLKVYVFIEKLRHQDNCRENYSLFMLPAFLILGIIHRENRVKFKHSSSFTFMHSDPTGAVSGISKVSNDHFQGHITAKLANEISSQIQALNKR